MSSNGTENLHKSLSAVAGQVLDRSPMAFEVMLHQPDIVEVVLFGLKLIIGIDVNGIPGDTLKEIDAIISADYLVQTFGQMMQRRARFVCVPHLMETQVDVA